MTGRAVPEWQGKTPDTPVPPHVRLRVLLAHDRRCYLSGREIRPGDAWEIEHKRALALGGENRESNLGPALTDAHKVKTAQDVATLAKDRRVAKKHLGLKPRSRNPLAGGKQSPWKRTVDGRTVRRDAE